MTITYVNGSTSGTDSTTSPTCAAPVSIASGDLLVAYVYMGNNTTCTGSGWTAFQNQGSNSSAVLYKVAGSEPGTYTFTLGTATGFDMIILHYSGASGLDGNPSFGGFSSGTTGTANSVTPAGSADKWVTFFAAQTSTATASTPTGFTARDSNIDSTRNESQWAFEEQLASSSATGTASTTFSGSVFWVSASLLLSPSVPAAYAPSGARPSFTPQVQASNWRGWTKKLSGLVVPPFTDQRLILGA